jgi:hypothetical protein
MPELRDSPDWTYEGDSYALPQGTLAEDAVLLPTVHGMRLGGRLQIFRLEGI